MIQIELSNPSFESCIKCIHSDDSEETCILRRCIHAVAQLKECYVPKKPTIEPQQKWIPCSERYPDMDERVLVYTVAHDYHVWDCMSNRADNYFWEDEEGLYHNKYEVGLWMPLPEVYREGAQE